MGLIIRRFGKVLIQQKLLYVKISREQVVKGTHHGELFCGTHVR